MSSLLAWLQSDLFPKASPLAVYPPSLLLTFRRQLGCRVGSSKKHSSNQLVLRRNSHHAKAASSIRLQNAPLPLPPSILHLLPLPGKRRRRRRRKALLLGWRTARGTPQQEWEEKLFLPPRKEKKSFLSKQGQRGLGEKAAARIGRGSPTAALKVRVTCLLNLLPRFPDSVQWCPMAEVVRRCPSHPRPTLRVPISCTGAFSASPT